MCMVGGREGKGRGNVDIDMCNGESRAGEREI